MCAQQVSLKTALHRYKTKERRETKGAVTPQTCGGRLMYHIRPLLSHDARKPCLVLLARVRGKEDLCFGVSCFFFAFVSLVFLLVIDALRAGRPCVYAVRDPDVQRQQSPSALPQDCGIRQVVQPIPVRERWTVLMLPPLLLLGNKVVREWRAEIFLRVLDLYISPLCRAPAPHPLPWRL